MSTRERKRRERETREQLFTRTAQDLIRREGLLHLQMSRLAEACDYATGTLYQHFSSKEDLLIAIATEDLKRRASAFAPIPGLPASSRERMLAVVLTDIDFISSHPDHFQLLQYVSTEVIWASASIERRQALVQAGAPISEAVSRVVADAIQAGDLDGIPSLRPVEIAAGFWCLNTGMHTLAHTHGLLEAYAVRDPYALLVHHSHALLNGLGWKPLIDPGDTKAVMDEAEQIRALLAHHASPEGPAGAS
jgi:AcrR family transcriptional regulator